MWFLFISGRGNQEGPEARNPGKEDPESVLEYRFGYLQNPKVEALFPNVFIFQNRTFKR